MTETRKILITGTHLTPAIEFIHQLKTDREIDWEIYYIGRLYNSSIIKQKSIESEIIPRNNVKFYGILCGKFDRRWLPNTISGLPQIISGIKKAYLIIKKIKPRLIVSFGGYVSVPVIIAAWIQKIPSITHEQTLTLSLSTKINSLFSRFTALSFSSYFSSDKYLVTGNLLRREIYNQHSSFFENQKINLKKFPLIFLTAGNQGSHHLNLTLKKILPTLSDKYTIIHQTGPKDYSNFKKLTKTNQTYFVHSFIDSKNIGWIFHHAKLIISRAGANTTQEIAALNQNSIVIPLPQSQQNEQLKNAKWLQKKHPQNTIIIKDTDLTPELLEKSIKKMINKRHIIPSTTPSPNLKLLKLAKRL